MSPFPFLHILIRLLRFHRRDDWVKSTIYCGYKIYDVVIQWFWTCVRSWAAERRSKLLRFVTGTTRIPVNGFDDPQGPYAPLDCIIDKAGDPRYMPKSHASINCIDLPPYEDYATLEHKLTLAVERVSLTCP